MDETTLYIEETIKTPKIHFEQQSGELSITGRSIPENSIEFYNPVFNWINEYVKTPSDKTIVQVNLEYFNTSSSKCLVEVFRSLEQLHTDGKNIEINWYYAEDDEDMEESGIDFKEVTHIPINMIVIDGD